MKILSIKPVTTKKGNPQILIQTASQDVWVSVKQWQSKGCSNNLDSYVGGDIEVDYFKTGEKLINGTDCTKDNILLRDFIPSANPIVLANALAVENNMRMSNMLDKSALFSRQREAAKPAVDADKSLAH